MSLFGIVRLGFQSVRCMGFNCCSSFTSIIYIIYQYAYVKVFSPTDLDFFSREMSSVVTFRPGTAQTDFSSPVSLKMVFSLWDM